MSLILVSSSVCAASTVFAAGLDVAELEARVLSGELTPAAAITEYCKGDSVDMTQDAFCSCPEEALRILEDRLKSYHLDAS